MNRTSLPALALASLVTAAGAAAALAAPAQSAFVREHALALVEGALTPEQATTLQLVAYQSAIANVCEGFDIDPPKFATAFEALAPAAANEMTDDQKAYHDQHVLVIFGVLVGGELGAIGNDPAAACAQAALDKADPDLASELVWQ